MQRLTVSQASSTGVGTVRCTSVRYAPARGTLRCRAVTDSRSGSSRAMDGDRPAGALRRDLLIGTAMLPVLAHVQPSKATTQGFKKFLGYSQAPDLYLGYGQAKDAAPMYSFEYPADWEEETPTKTEKSTMGMDGRVIAPRTRKEMAYVVALGGKDYRDSVLKDAKTSLTVIAGGDPDMRQALTDGVVKQDEKRINGTAMYVYDVKSDKRHYLSTIGKKGDTVYALVVTAPANAYEKDAEGLRHIQETFQLL